ncbi:MAG TPA: archease [Urbifossiella sp.]|nr:archease [Urbifossiella sp.]
MYELFEHTADLGLRATAPELDTLFAEMAKCLFTAIVDDPSSIAPKHETTVLIDGTDREFLMFDWLRHLLYLFDAGKEVYSEFEVKILDTGLTAIAFGEPFDPERHLLNHEVKAITYHELAVEPVEGGWRAEVIVDI